MKDGMLIMLESESRLSVYKTNSSYGGACVRRKDREATDFKTILKNIDE